MGNNSSSDDENVADITSIESKPAIRVKELWIYPIKSCRGIRVNEAKITKKGFEHDRLFMVVDHNNRFLTQRTVPILSIVQPTISIAENGDFVMKLEAKDMDDMSMIMDENHNISIPRFDTIVWSQSIPSYEPSGEASVWFSKLIGKPVRLVAMDTSYRRGIADELSSFGGDEHKSDVSYADLFAFHMISMKSLEALNQRLVDAGHDMVSVKNFRPNIVIDGTIDAFIEDDWYDIQFYHNQTSSTDHSDHDEEVVMNMRVMKPRARCNIPTVDDSTGQYNSKAQPTKTMKTFRTGSALNFSKSSWQGAVFFGLDVDHFGQDGATLKVDDGFRVLLSLSRWYD